MLFWELLSVRVAPRALVSNWVLANVVHCHGLVVSSSKTIYICCECLHLKIVSIMQQLTKTRKLCITSPFVSCVRNKRILTASSVFIHVLDYSLCSRLDRKDTKPQNEFLRIQVRYCIEVRTILYFLTPFLLSLFNFNSRSHQFHVDIIVSQVSIVITHSKKF